MGNFEIIGEVVKHPSSGVTATYPALSWRRIAGFREVLIHQYMGVDVVEVWNVVERDLPALRLSILAICRDLGSPVP